MNCANHPDRERKAFCQNCGKPLCVECARTVGQAVFCEPCLEIRLAAANAAAAGPTQPFGTGPTASGRYQAVPGAVPNYNPAGASTGGGPFFAGFPPFAGASNPGLAFGLGFIPAVGAMYNGQYAKGVVHLIVFAVLVSLADQNGIFGLFVTFWIFYQAFEAYHTARARRDGTPLPNFFGLNDIGERFGFGRSWTPISAGGPISGSTPTSSASGSAGPVSSGQPSVQPPPYTPPPTNYPPVEYGSSTSSSAYTERVPPFTESAPVWGAPVEGYAQSIPPLPPVAPASQFPVGAVVLIGLGVLFLVGNTHLFLGLPIRYLLPVLLIGLGVYLFVRRMTATGAGLVADGSVAYRLRLVRALQGSVWVVLVGVLFLLDTLNILSWGRSWPLFIIVGGVMAFVQRSASTAAAQQSPFYGYGPAAPQTPPAPASADPGTDLVPRDREGS